MFAVSKLSDKINPKFWQFGHLFLFVYFFSKGTFENSEIFKAKQPKQQIVIFNFFSTFP